MVIEFVDPFPTPEEIAETMKDPLAGIVGQLYGFVVDEDEPGEA